jgi:hypothetical protein
LSADLAELLYYQVPVQNKIYLEYSNEVHDAIAAFSHRMCRCGTMDFSNGGKLGTMPHWFDRLLPMPPLTSVQNGKTGCFNSAYCGLTRVVCLPGSERHRVAQWWMVKRSIEIHQIFQSVFGSSFSQVSHRYFVDVSDLRPHN